MDPKDEKAAREKVVGAVKKSFESVLSPLMEEVEVNIAFKPKAPVRNITLEYAYDPEGSHITCEEEFSDSENLFPTNSDYNSKELIDLFEPGHLYHYIGNTFLDGYINLVTRVKAYLLERYTTQRERYEEEVWTPFLKNPPYHTKLYSTLHDDVLILAESPLYYWFFWYDCDCSDCTIGRAHRRLHTPQQAAKWFDNYVKKLVVNLKQKPYRDECPAWPEENDWEGGITSCREIPVECFKGWIGF